MSKVLLLFAHPALEKSRVHKLMLKSVAQLPGITIRDLYQEYPDFYIDIREEQRLLLAHDIILFQHPFYWYSCPAIIKEWQDLVLQHQWAYGVHGKALQGKKWIHAISAGGRRQAYAATGLNRFTIRQLLAPLEQTSHLCNMEFLPPFVVHNTHRLSQPEIDTAAQQYKSVVQALINDDLPAETLHSADYINDLFVTVS